jgi:pullulanase/glycogen debranching enzyme
VIDMHVDGFRFDLASWTRPDPTGSAAHPPMLDMIPRTGLAHTEYHRRNLDAAVFTSGQFTPHHRWA